jgi:hypothetical protein
VHLTVVQIEVYRQALIAGNTVTEHAFISTSKSELVARMFNGNTVFQMISKTGKEIESISRYPIEKEILFCKNTAFNVLNVTQQDGITLIIMEEV